MQFGPEDDDRYWFDNSMHFPEPMRLFDMVTAEAAYCALGSSNSRVHCLPTTPGIGYRILNGRVYIGGNAVTDPAEIARRTEEFQKRASYYYEHWEPHCDAWKDKMRALIKNDRNAKSVGIGVVESGSNRVLLTQTKLRFDAGLGQRPTGESRGAGRTRAHRWSVVSRRAGRRACR
ncbi:MAG: hypothetical protein OEX13_19270 [Gammaproteobacteria bacterium]|nr:hypothetical protein [Gammaproteobacteria bacterium]